MDQAESSMSTNPCQFEKLVNPYYATLNHFAAAMFANPMVASILAPDIFSNARTARLSP
jgi:hypothetical protein